jgi:hypothetical protein
MVGGAGAVAADLMPFGKTKVDTAKVTLIDLFNAGLAAGGR